MSAFQARLVTLCQQTLALGVVLAVLTPASGVVSLDIVGDRPGPAPSGAAAAAPARLTAATVPTRAVTPEVTEVPLTTPTGGTGALAGRSVLPRPTTSSRVVSTPQGVTGYAAVGVTWQHGEELDEQEISVRVRTRTGDDWTAWEELEYHDEHGPDPDSPEGAAARPGTEPLLVGEVDDVQVEARTSGTPLPEDLSLALVDPGAAGATDTQPPAAAGSRDATGTEAYEDEFAEQGSMMGDDEAEAADGLSLSAARAAAQPTVFSRAQWGADEGIRDKSSLRYGSISAGFVHHTVNANDYTEAQVPAIMRSIYAYHVKSRGWSDIGYNFLVDRFGRIWEGRYGGIDKPVVGAHTLGYNDYSFAMSAIGNFDVTEPPDVMLRAYGQLFAWKLSLHGVNPASTSQQVGRSTFAAINGHRDAGSTACPGKYLYAKIPTIRTYATESAPVPPPAPVTVSVGSPAPQNNLAGTPYPDLVVRRAADGAALIVPTGGLTSFASRKVVGKKGWDERADVFVSPDLTGDSHADLVAADRSGVVRIRAGKGTGRFGATAKKLRLGGFSLLTAVGDVNGDGRNDLAGRFKGQLTTLLATGKGGFKRKQVTKGFGNYVQLLGVGDVTGDGRNDLVARRKGGLHLYPGAGGGSFGARRSVAGSWSGYDRLAGGDYTGDGRPDLIARARKGDVHVLPGRGDGSFGSPLGPVANLRSMRFLSGGSQLSGGAGADLVGVAGKSLVVLVNRDTFELGAAVETGVSFAGMDLILNAGDVDRDGFGDVLTRDGSGQLWLFRGNGQGQLAAGTVIGTGWNGITGLSAVGDVTGDGLPDLIGTMGSQLTVWRGNGSGFAAAAPVAGRTAAKAGLPADLSPYDWIIPVQDLRLGKGNDYVVRERATGRLLLYAGRSSGVSTPRLLGEGWVGYDLAG